MASTGIGPGRPPQWASCDRRNRQLDVVAGREAIHGYHHIIGVQPNQPPVRCQKHQDGEAALRQILLVSQILVGVTMASNPSASAVQSNSPFCSAPQPCS